MTSVGVISDTHGLMRPEVSGVFKRVDLILHAGDIGKPEVLDELQRIAPVVAVRGNNDKGAWARRIPVTQQTEVGTVRIFMIHDLKELKLRPYSDDLRVIVSGHSHRPLIEHRNGLLFLNPGSAGPRRFSLPISVARLTIRNLRVDAKLIEI